MSVQAPAQVQLGAHRNSLDQDARWQILAAARADIVLIAHDHDYERYMPMDANGDADRAKGVTQMVVGTGGASHNEFHSLDPTSAVRIAGRNGVVRLQLSPEAFARQFLEAPDGEILDSGNTGCR